MTGQHRFGQPSSILDDARAGHMQSSLLISTPYLKLPTLSSSACVLFRACLPSRSGIERKQPAAHLIPRPCRCGATSIFLTTDGRCHVAATFTSRCDFMVRCCGLLGKAFASAASFAYTTAASHHEAAKTLKPCSPLQQLAGLPVGAWKSCLSACIMHDACRALLSVVTGAKLTGLTVASGHGSKH